MPRRAPRLLAAFGLCLLAWHTGCLGNTEPLSPRSDANLGPLSPFVPRGSEEADDDHGTADRSESASDGEDPYLTVRKRYRDALLDDEEYDNAPGRPPHGRRAFLSADEECLSNEFQCRNGECNRGDLKCDGFRDCVDASDEETAECKKGTLTLPLGSIVQVRVLFKKEFEAVQFSLCDGNDCDSILIDGANSTGVLWYTHSTGCNAMGFACKNSRRMIDSQPETLECFDSGELVFQVEHRPSALYVWLHGFPEGAAKLTGRSGNALLRVRPLFWTNSMQVTFGAKEICQSTDFRCNSGECISCFLRCNGKTDCADGSDEDSNMCANGTAVLYPGAPMEVRIPFTEENEALLFSLCGGSEEETCSTVQVRGDSPRSELWYQGFRRCNRMGWFCETNLLGDAPRGYRKFRNGEHIFGVEHSSRGISVWLSGHYDKAVTVPTVEGSNLLRFRPWCWPSEQKAIWPRS